MTARKHFKQLVRERMRRTGERYSVARVRETVSAPALAAARGRVVGRDRRHRAFAGR